MNERDWDLENKIEKEERAIAAQQHTPTPCLNNYEMDGRAVDIISDIIEQAGLSLKGKTFGQHRDFIVRAVNSHKDLMDIAEMCAALECVAPDSCLHCDAEKAIKVAEGE